MEKDKNSWEFKTFTIVGKIGSGMSTVVNYEEYLKKKLKEEKLKMNKRGD